MLYSYWMVFVHDTAMSIAKITNYILYLSIIFNRKHITGNIDDRNDFFFLIIDTVATPNIKC